MKVDINISIGINDVFLYSQEIRLKSPLDVSTFGTEQTKTCINVVCLRFDKIISKFRDRS